MQRDEHTHTCLLKQRTLNVDRYGMSESFKESSLPMEGFRIDDTMKKPPKKLGAIACDAKQKKKTKKRSETKDKKEKSKKDGHRARPESMVGRDVSWSRSYLESTEELPFHDYLVTSTKTSQQHRYRPQSNDETHKSRQIQEIVVDGSEEIAIDDLERVSTSMHRQDSNPTSEKSLQSNKQDSAKSSGSLGQDTSVASNTATAFETFLRRQRGLQKTSSSGSMNSFAIGHTEDDSFSDGDCDDPFRESKFWGSESTLLIGEDDDVKSFQGDNDASASFGRVRRNEAFVKLISSKDMLSSHSMPSTKSMDKTLSSPDSSGMNRTPPNHTNATAFRCSIRSLDALIPCERTVEQELATLSWSQRACVDKLKSQWEEYDEGKHVFPNEWYLRVARCSPGGPFNFKSAWKVMKRFECHYYDLRMSKMEKSVLRKIAFPVPGLKTKSGRDVFYMKLGRYFPRETPMDIFFDLLVYVMNCMLEKEHGSVHGLGVVANMTGWKMENFSVPYWHKFLMILQGYRVPTRISLFLIVNPPFWFGSIWKIMKTMMSEDFQKKVAVIGFDELDRYLMDGCFHHLPDDVEGGTLNTDMLVKAFIAERKAIESKPLYGQEQTISMSNSSIHLN